MKIKPYAYLITYGSSRNLGTEMDIHAGTILSWLKKKYTSNNKYDYYILNTESLSLEEYNEYFEFFKDRL